MIVESLEIENATWFGSAGYEKNALMGGGEAQYFKNPSANELLSPYSYGIYLTRVASCPWPNDLNNTL